MDLPAKNYLPGTTVPLVNDPGPTPSPNYVPTTLHSTPPSPPPSPLSFPFTLLLLFLMTPSDFRCSAPATFVVEETDITDTFYRRSGSTTRSFTPGDRSFT